MSGHRSNRQTPSELSVLQRAYAILARQVQGGEVALEQDAADRELLLLYDLAGVLAVRLGQAGSGDVVAKWKIQS